MFPTVAVIVGLSTKLLKMSIWKEPLLVSCKVTGIYASNKIIPGTS
jgi:hypothetical protein